MRRGRCITSFKCISAPVTNARCGRLTRPISQELVVTGRSVGSAGPVEWGVLLSLGESMWLTELDLKHDHRPEVLLQKGDGWIAEPYYRFDVGFVEDSFGSTATH